MTKKLKIVAHTVVGDVTVKVNLKDVDADHETVEGIAAWLEANITSALVSLPGDFPYPRFRDIEITD